MNAEKRGHFKDQLVKLRERLGGEVNNVAQAIQEEVNVKSNLSAAPVHLADVANGVVDADVEVLQTERNILDQVNEALVRIDAGTYGKCEDCGASISEERLKALPFASRCVRCARELNEQNL